MEYLIIPLVIAVVVALAARDKGRNPIGWFIYAFLLWPVAAIHISLAKRNTDRASDRRSAYDEKTCPQCAETVKVAARVCRFCGYKFVDV